MEKGYAYLDKAGILHITKNKITAKKYSKSGTIVEVERDFKYGYPVVDGEGVIVYSPTEMKVDGEGKCIPVIPELAELYRACK